MLRVRVGRRPRLALYSHDAQGLGHVRRNLAIAAALADGRRDILLISGSREAGCFPLPDGVELITLPALAKSIEGAYRPRSLRLQLDALIRLRACTMHAALASFAPDVLIVDKLPLGVKGELGPALERLRSSPMRLVLGLREILDDPDAVRREARITGSQWAMRELYDAIWVYGDPRVYDPIREYGFGPAIAAKARFTGYLGRAHREATNPRRHSETARAGARALCLVGGGEDGFAVASAFARSRLPAGTAGTIVT